MKGDYAGQSSGRASSVGSSTRADFGKQGNKYHDETRLYAAVKLFSTLNGTGNDSGDNTRVDQNFMKTLRASRKSTYNSIDEEKSSLGITSSRNMIIRLEKMLLKRIFQINHVVLSQQAVTTLIFHVFIAFRALQLVFNVFYTVEIIDEFHVSTSTTSVVNQNAYRENLLNSEILDPLLNQNSTSTNYSSAIITKYVEQTFRIDEYLSFTNFHYYVLKSGGVDNPENSFILLYGLLNGIFILLLCLLFGVSGKVFEQSKIEDMKETTKLLLKFLSILMCLYIFLFQVPMLALLLEGYQCTDGISQGLVIDPIECGSLTHKILMVFSTLLLIIYLGFLIIQSVLYNSNSFEHSVPWSSFERTLALVRVLKSFVVAAGFTYDRAGLYRGQINLVCLAIQLYIVARRLKGAILFKNSVFYASIIYESLVAWLYITVAIHLLSGTKLSITSLSMLVIAGISLSLILVAYQMKKKDEFSVNDNIEKYQEPMQIMIYFFRLHKVIEDHDPSAEIIMQGKLRKHCHDCIHPGCVCLNMLEYFDDMRRMREVLEAFAKDEDNAALMTTTQHPRSISGTIDKIIGIQNVDGPSNNNTLLGPPTNLPGEEISEFGTNNLQALMKDQDIISQLITRDTGNISVIQQNTGITTFKDGQSIKNLNSPNTFIQKTSLELANKDQQNESQIYFNWLARRRKQVQFEDNLNRIFEVQHDRDEVQKCYYQLLGMMIMEQIEKFPKHIDLRIINAFVQKSKLNNEFKAIFEMMNCELCDPSIFEQFVIFRSKIQVEQQLVKQHQKNIQKIGTIDVSQVFKYEKLFQRYQLYEYLTTYAAQCFWRELLQKQINASILQEKGSEISQYFEQIQDIAKQLQQIYPNEIKFFFRYGNFLLYIIHNEFDALESYRQAQNVFQMKITKKGNAMPINEHTIFGENSASAVIIISATSSKIGTIIHCNEEIENVLKYKRQELIGKNVSILTPRPIAKVHDRLVQRYFETAKPTVIEIKRQLFGVTKEGYLQEIELIVKVLPEINDKLIFVGFMQKTDRFEDMEPPSGEMDRHDKQYLVTDYDGNITNVTEGLMYDLGLHSKFFNYSDSIFQQMFNIQKICNDVLDPAICDQLEMEGKNLQFDTSMILNNIELEQLNSDEILEVRANLGRYEVYTQCKRLTISAYCKIFIYRLIILGKYNQNDTLGNGFKLASVNKDFQLSNQVSNPNDASGTQDDTLGGMMSVQNSMSGSMSSTTSNSFSFNRVIKDFKKALSERKTPRNLMILNRIIIVILLALIILTSINFSQLNEETARLHEGKEQNLMIESRSLKFIQLSSNVRSLINVANKIEFDRYDGSRLQPIDRFDYLETLILEQAENLQEIHEIISKKRLSGAGSGNEEEDYDKMQSEYEYLDVQMFRLDDSNQVSSYPLPFRVGLQTYLNYILTLNQTDRSLIKLPQELLYNPVYENKPFKITQNTTQLQKGVFFLLANAYRSLRTHSRDATIFFQKSYFLELQTNPFLAVTLVGLMLSVTIFGGILYQIWLIERNKVRILSLYAFLQPTEIESVYNSCVIYMENLNSGSMMSILQETEQAKDNSFILQGQLMNDSQANASIKSPLGIGLSSNELIIPLGNQNQAGKHQNLNGSIMSEEEKDEIDQKQLIEKKRKQRAKENKRQGGKTHNSGSLGGQELYTEMIRLTFENVKCIIEKEDITKSGFAKTAKRMQKDLKSSLAAAGSQVEVDNMNLNNQKKSRKQQIESQQQMSKQPSQTIAKKQKGNKKLKKQSRKEQLEDGVFENNKDDDSTQNNKAFLTRRTSVQVKTQHAKHRKENDMEEEKTATQSDADSHSDENGSVSSRHNNETKEEREERRRKRREKLELEEMQREQSESTNQELLERQQYFVRTIKNEQYGKVSFTIGLMLVFCAYFIQLYVYNGQFKSYITHIQEAIPLFLGRFRHNMLAFAMLRERIIFNNTMDFLDYNNEYGYDLDIQKIEESMQNEKELTLLKNNHKAIIAGMIDFIKLADSENFCTEIVINGQFQQDQYVNDPAFVENISAERIKLSKPYESLIQTIVPLQMAAITGNVTRLKQLRSRGTIDFDSLNYDRRTPLHLAVKNGNYEAVQYLASLNVNINAIDRWGATPLTYSKDYPQIRNFLTSLNATLGGDSENYKALGDLYADSSLTEDDYRVFYAAYFDDDDSLKILNGQGKLKPEVYDSDGRSALAVAASQGSLKAVKYLIFKGADPAMRDSRYRNSLQEAKRESRTLVVQYLESIINERIILNYCANFQEGLLSKGLQQAVGNFHKRFADLQIKVNHALTRAQQLQLLSSPLAVEDPSSYYSVNTLKIFYQTQELYYFKTIEKMISVIRQVFNTYLNSYASTTETLFLLFLGFQILMLLQIRGSLIKAMRQDIFKSRGMLNLIPDSFFEQNRTKVEKLIKNLKD